jgi:hypothetical protein
MKRGSDSLLDAKLREQLTHARSMSDRARSLDLTASLSRITESSSSGFLPESPTDADFHTTTDSPNTNTTLSFPSVYGPPASGRSSGGGTPQSMRRQGRSLEDDSLNSTFQNLGL